MPKYIFSLGQNSSLSIAELNKVLGEEQEVKLINNKFVLAETNENPEALINKLGGIIKISRLLDKIDNIEDLSPYSWFEYINKNISKDKKVNFAFSLYPNNKKDYSYLKASALELKKILREKNYKARLVTGQESVLSSVIVKKNKLIGTELLIIKNDTDYLIALTEAVQDFMAYGFRDMKRPSRDDKSGMLPPKLAQMMINLGQAEKTATLLDPFCGSGTIVQEAILLGYKNIYASDISGKATRDTKANIDWLDEKFNKHPKVQIIKSDASKISQHIKNNSIDLIVTEPFMGDAKFVNKQHKISELKNTSHNLQELYYRAFKEFTKILKNQAKVVFVFPRFTIKDQSLDTLDKESISSLGYQMINKKELLYSRADQKVQRNITIWQIKK